MLKPMSLQQQAVNAETLGLVSKSGPSRTTNLFLVGLGVVAIGGAIGFIIYILNTQDCETNGDCESGVCNKNKCVECVKNSDCNPGFECKENVCKKKPTAPPRCAQDSDCTEEQPSCKNGECFCTDASCKAQGDNFVCDSGGGCIDTTARECTKNDDCAIFKKCSGNKCVTNELTLGLVIAVSVLVAGALVVVLVRRKLKYKSGKIESYEKDDDDFVSSNANQFFSQPRGSVGDLDRSRKDYTGQRKRTGSIDQEAQITPTFFKRKRPKNSPYSRLGTQIIREGLITRFRPS